MTYSGCATDAAGTETEKTAELNPLPQVGLPYIKLELLAAGVK